VEWSRRGDLILHFMQVGCRRLRQANTSNGRCCCNRVLRLTSMSWLQAGRFRPASGATRPLELGSLTESARLEITSGALDHRQFPCNSGYTR
jgi:hypothetical protein